VSSPGVAAVAAVFVSAAALGLPAVAEAQLTATPQQFEVQAEVVEGCVLIGSTQSAGLDFGTMDFGSAPAIVPAQLPGTAMTGGLATQLWCTPGMSMQISVDAGLHAAGSQRRLARSGGGEVSYSLFADEGRSVAIPVSGSVPLTAPTDGLLDLPIYGLATVPGTPLMPGIYTDTVQVTISW
jgi:spore coat protein U-like protein